MKCCIGVIRSAQISHVGCNSKHFQIGRKKSPNYEFFGMQHNAARVQLAFSIIIVLAIISTAIWNIYISLGENARSEDGHVTAKIRIRQHYATEMLLPKETETEHFDAFQMISREPTRKQPQYWWKAINASGFTSILLCRHLRLTFEMGHFHAWHDHDEMWNTLHQHLLAIPNSPCIPSLNNICSPPSERELAFYLAW